MILITGGLGFIGSHTARSLTDIGERCVLTSHNNSEIPSILTGTVGTSAVVEQVDVSDGDALIALGRRHEDHRDRPSCRPGRGKCHELRRER